MENRRRPVSHTLSCCVVFTLFNLQIASAPASVLVSVVAVDRYTGSQVRFQISEVRVSPATMPVAAPPGNLLMHTLLVPLHTKLGIRGKAQGVPFSRVAITDVIIDSPNQVVVLTADSMAGHLLPGSDVIQTTVVVGPRGCKTKTFQWVAVFEAGAASATRLVTLRDCKAELGLLRPGTYSMVLHDGGSPVAVAEVKLLPVAGQRRVERLLEFVH